MEPKGIAFEVWQDFMPGVGRSGPPLLAVVELEVSNGAGLNAGNTSGAITITRQSGEVLLSAARLTLRQQSDDLGMAQPGPRRLLFGTEPAQITATLTEGETLQGTAVITLAGQRFEIALPQTTLMFTH